MNAVECRIARVSAPDDELSLQLQLQMLVPDIVGASSQQVICHNIILYRIS